MRQHWTAAVEEGLVSLPQSRMRDPRLNAHWPPRHRQGLPTHHPGSQVDHQAGRGEGRTASERQDRSSPPELPRLGRMVARCKEEIFAYHWARISNAAPMAELCGKVVFGIHGTEVESLS